jgi:hypothetical protein
MALINDASRDQKLSGLVAYDHEKHAPTGFSEVFSASLGQVFDEELSISSALNREGFSERNAKIDALAESGEISDINRYRRMEDRQIDYDEAARELGRDDIKTDEQLNLERNETLKARRQYAQDVVSRGTGMAQFLGAMTGYMLDPINVATVGIAAPAVTAKSASVLGRAMMTSKNAALIGVASEIGIQTLVYQHKQAIDSPYTAGDALANIAFAATGAAALGFVEGGLSGWLGKVLKTSEELPETPEVTTAKDYLRRQHETLKGAPVVERIDGEDLPTFEKRQIESDVEYLNEMGKRAKQYAPPSKEPGMYEPRPQADDKPRATVSQREHDILEAQGLTKALNDEMAKFNTLDNKMLQVDDELVNAEDLIKQFDDEIQGLDDVFKCAYG